MCVVAWLYLWPGAVSCNANSRCLHETVYPRDEEAWYLKKPPSQGGFLDFSRILLDGNLLCLLLLDLAKGDGQDAVFEDSANFIFFDLDR